VELERAPKTNLRDKVVVCDDRSSDVERGIQYVGEVCWDVAVYGEGLRLSGSFLFGGRP
jgi:hypothetical protein